VFRAVLSAAPNNSCQPTLHTRMAQAMGISECRSQYARARSSAAFAFSKHHKNYTQLRNEVLILLVKLKETLNYVFTWDFCWVLNVRITCRLTALHVTQFTYAHGRASQTNTCLRSFSPQSFAPTSYVLLHHSQSHR
jgi:hypothetical protein